MTLLAVWFDGNTAVTSLSSLLLCSVMGSLALGVVNVSSKWGWGALVLMRSEYRSGNRGGNVSL